MDEPLGPLVEASPPSPPDSTPRPATLDRRRLFRIAAAGSVGLAVDGFINVPAAKAAAGNLKLMNIQEFTTSCNFCSCGCGMIAAVRDGKLISMEGDYDHIVNRGSLCVKGISMFATHASPRRLQTPKYRAPGSDHWEEISWQDAIEKVAQRIHKTRSATWIATEKVNAPDLVVDDAAGDARPESAPRFVPHEGPRDVPVNRTDAMGFMGGAQNTNEECYLFQKAARLLGMSYVEHQARL